MIRIIQKVIFLLSLLVLASSCSEEEPVHPDDLVFYSLVAETDTIAPGKTVRITASATGTGLVYYWSAKPFGAIVGSGAEVTYLASPCAMGVNEVTCEVTNGPGRSQSKTVVIVVYE